MFQASVWTGLFFVIGIAINSRPHAVWVVAASALGMLVANYQTATGLQILDPEQLITRVQSENVTLGLMGYNATLAALALFLNRQTLVAPILGIILTVPLTQFLPLLGVPALTAPFVLATWIVLFLEYLEPRLFQSRR
jgi:urea transporter